jgi:hypothetical protein
MMKCAYLLSLLLVLPFSTTHAEGVAPEIVWVDKVTVTGDVKRVTMESDTGLYVLDCNLKASGCITPAPQVRYYLFSKSTWWQMPGAKHPIDLKFVQDWTANYPDGENIGLVPANSPPDLPPTPEPFGMFILESWSKR